MSKEIIKPVPGYEGRYGVSDQGNVYRYRKMKDGTILMVKKKHFLSGSGYFTSILCVNSKEIYINVHQLVAQTFLGKPHPKSFSDY
jgi:hypothetical protein